MDEEQHKPKVDILGLMVKPIPGWEERARLLARPELFNGYTPKVELLKELNDVEKKRLFRKLRLVKKYAEYMAAGMVKGTLKYEHDDYTIEQWMAHLMGEGADQSNYALLLFDAWWRQKV